MDENNKFNEELNVGEESLPMDEATNQLDEDWNKMLQADAQMQEQPAEEASPKAKSKKPFIIGGAVVAVLAIAALVIGIMSSSPLGVVAKGAKNTSEAIAAHPLLTLLEKVGTGGSVETVIDLAELDMGVSLDGSINAKICTDLEKQGTAVSFSAVLEDMTILDLLLVMDQQEVALSSDVLLGGESYGVDLEQAPEKFDSSIFGYNGAYSIGIESLEQYVSDTGGGEEMTEELNGHVADILAALAESVQKHAEMDKESDVLDFNGESVKTHAVSVAVNDETAAQIVFEMLEYILGNAELKEFLYANPAYVTSILQMENPYAVDVYDFSEEEAVATLDEMYAKLEELAADTEELRSELEGFALELVFHVSKADKYLVGVEACVEAEGEKYEFEILAGPSIDALRELSIKTDDGYSDSRVTYTVDLNDKNVYSSELRIQQDGETVFSGEIDWNKSSGELLMDFEDQWGEAYGIEANLSYSDKETIVQIERITANGESALVGIDLILKPSDEIPDIPEYVELLDMTEAEFEAVTQEIMSAVQEIAMMFYGMPSLSF